MLTRFSDTASSGIDRFSRSSTPAPANTIPPPSASGMKAATGLPSTISRTTSRIGAAMISARSIASIVCVLIAFAASTKPTMCVWTPAGVTIPITLRSCGTVSLLAASRSRLMLMRSSARSGRGCRSEPLAPDHGPNTLTDGTRARARVIRGPCSSSWRGGPWIITATGLRGPNSRFTSLSALSAPVPAIERLVRCRRSPTPNPITPRIPTAVHQTTTTTIGRRIA